MSETYEVGQKVLLFERYRRGAEPREMTVTKVGRKLVTVEQYGRPVQFRIESGHINDAFGSARICTPAAYAAEQAASKALAELRELGVRFDVGSRRLSLAALGAITEIVRAEAGHE